MDNKVKLGKWLYLLVFCSLVLICLPFLMIYFGFFASQTLTFQERNTLFAVLLLVSLYPLPHAYSLCLFYRPNQKKTWLILLGVLEAIVLTLAILAFLYLIQIWQGAGAKITAWISAGFLGLVLGLLPFDVFYAVNKSKAEGKQ
jgi:hypothetical protein